MNTVEEDLLSYTVKKQKIHLWYVIESSCGENGQCVIDFFLLRSRKYFVIRWWMWWSDYFNTVIDVVFHLLIWSCVHGEAEVCCYQSCVCVCLWENQLQLMCCVMSFDGADNAHVNNDLLHRTKQRLSFFCCDRPPFMQIFCINLWLPDETLWHEGRTGFYLRCIWTNVWTLDLI